MRLQRIGAGAILLLVACANRSSCSGRGGASNATGPELAACTAWATHYCDRLAACAPVSLAVDYGDEASCVDRGRPACLSALRAPSTGATPSTVTACAQAYETASCEDVVVGRPPPACRVAGSLPTGAACGDDWQCAAANGAGHCKMAPDEGCGTCAVLGGPRDSCDSDRDCQYGLVCYFTCMAPVAAGEACDGMTRQCQQTLICLDYMCSRPYQAGAACSARADPCDRDHGLYCDPEKKVCSPYAAAEVGAPCGSGILCRASTCMTDDPTETARCVAAADDGARCDPQNGRPCRAPARCQDGVCRALDPSRCR
jgi:hypothetical protein